MQNMKPEEEEPVVRLKSALEYLRDEAARLKLDAVTNGINRVLLILSAQNKTRRRSQSQ